MIKLYKIVNGKLKLVDYGVRNIRLIRLYVLQGYIVGN